MTQATTSEQDAKAIVTPERFASAASYEEYLSQIKVNKERFEAVYDNLEISEEDRQFFSGLSRRYGAPIKVLVLTEDWCPDCYHNVPILAKIAAHCPDWEVRIFARDQNMDIMNLYLKDGQFQSIPAFVFYDRQFNEIGRWIERPAVHNQYNEELNQRLAQSQLSPEELRAERRRLGQEAFDNIFKYAAIQELRELLARQP